MTTRRLQNMHTIHMHLHALLLRMVTDLICQALRMTSSLVWHFGLLLLEGCTTTLLRMAS
jgi:hypothetical protein